ncbi:MAG: hypothetical protein FWD27_08290 [Coriobacteriia bacterium]|nr:hypothetical protein [Coriobacteriia bacterium]
MTRNAHQPIAKAAPLIIAAGVLLIFLGVYTAIETIRGIDHFLSYATGSSSSYVTMDIYPWPSAIFALVVNLFMVTTGALAIVFAITPKVAFPTAIVSVATSGLVFVRFLIFVISTFGILGSLEANPGLKVKVFGLLELPILVSIGLDAVVLFLILAATVTILIFSLLRLKKPREA